MRRIVSATIVTAIVAVSLHGQSLADVAKKAKEERDKVKQAQTRADDGKAGEPKSQTAPTKVYTNSDLPDSPARAAP